MSKFDALRDRLKAASPDPRSDSNNTSPLSLYLAIYTKANHECYINYMEGAKILRDWLSPIAIPMVNPSLEIPRILRGYELQELGQILSTTNNVSAYAMIERAIYTTLREN